MAEGNSDLFAQTLKTLAFSYKTVQGNFEWMQLILMRSPINYFKPITLACSPSINHEFKPLNITVSKTSSIEKYDKTLLHTLDQQSGLKKQRNASQIAL